MSSEQQQQPVDPQAVEETKQQIRGLVEEITRLSKQQDLEPAVFYGEFLQRVVQALAAIGGAVWILSDEGPLRLMYQINFRESLPGDDGEDQVRHAKLLQRVVQHGEELLVPPYSGAGADEEAGNPTAYLLVLTPIRSGERVAGVVEIFQRPNSSPASQRGYLRFLSQMCSVAGDYLKGRHLQQLTDWQSLFSKADRFSRSVHETLNPRTAAYTIANEGRRLIGCDRVSVAIKRGRKCTVEAVSGQDTMDSRANSVVLLSKLATAVVHNGEPLWYTGPTDKLPPQIEDAVHEYVDESHSKSIAVLPLVRQPEEVTDPEDYEKGGKKEGEPVGALIVEQIEDSRPPEEFAQSLELVTEHSGRALANAMEHNNLFLMPLWRTIGNARVLTKARTLPKTITIASVILLAIVMMFVFPWRFEMKAPGLLQPKIRREVFVVQPGVVDKVIVKQGEHVEKDDLLVQLRSEELELQITDLEGRRSELETSIQQITRSLQEQNVRSSRTRGQGPSGNAELASQKVQLITERDAIDTRLAVLEKQRNDLRILSPIDGQIVTTWDVFQTLEGRPVQTGQVLMTVVDPERDWEIQAFMPEKKMGHVRRALEKADGQRLEARYVVANEPETKRQGEVAEIYPSAETHEEHQHSVKMIIDIEDEQLADKRVGVSATVRVKCGIRPIGYVWFHDLFEFFQSRVLF